MPEYLGICIPKAKLSELRNRLGINIEQELQIEFESFLEQQKDHLEIICIEAANEDVFRKILSWKHTNLYVLLVREESCI